MTFDLLLTKKNWKICEPWLTPLRKNSNGNLKLNLLYKAKRDGFSHLNFKENYVKIYSDLFTNYYNKHLHSTYIDRSEQNFWEHINEKGLQDIIKRETMLDFGLNRNK